MKTNSYTSVFVPLSSWRWPSKLGFAILSLLIAITTNTSLAQITSYPHAEGFENGGSIPSGWSNEYVSDVIDWTFVSANGNATVAPRTGSYMAEFRFADYGPITMLVSPQFDLTGLTAPYLSFWYANVEWAGDIDAMQAYYSSDGGTTWTALGANITDEHTTWTEFATALPSPSADYLIGFEAESFWARGFNIDDVWVGEAPSCLAPSVLAAVVETDSATLSWTENGTATEWEIEFGEAPYTFTGTANVLGVLANPHELSLLDPQTEYVFYVRAICGVDDESEWSGPFSFTTTCAAISTFPFTEDFEDESETLACWQVIDNNGDGDTFFGEYLWTIFSGAGIGASNTLGIYTDIAGGDNDDYAILPQLTLNGDQQLRFSTAVFDSGEPNDFRVVLSTTGTEPEDFDTELLALTEVDWESFQEIAPIDLSAYTGNVYIAIHVPSGGLDGWYLFVDDLVVEDIPACATPTALNAVGGIDSAVLSWSENGTATTWDIEYGETPYTATGTPNVPGVTSNPYELIGLNTETEHVYYVRAVCDVDVESAWAGPFTFSTVPSAPAPYEATFAYLPSGWTNDVTLEAGWFLGGGGFPDDFNHQEVVYTNMWLFATNSALNSINIGTIPAGSDLTFDYVFADYGEDEDAGCTGDGTLSIYITDDFGATYTLLDELSVPAAGWNPASYDLSAYEGEYVSVQFRADWIDGDFHIAVDNFYVGPPPSCFQPTDVSVLATSLTDATISWVAPLDGTPVDYEYVFSTTNSVPGGSGTSSGGDTSVDLSALTSGDTYYLYVRTDCDGDGNSTWAGPVQITMPTIAEDICSGAISVVCDGGPYTGSTELATNDELVLCGYDPLDNEQFSPGVWYVFEGTGDAVTASLCGSDYDTRLNIFTGSCGSLLCVSGSDDFCSAQSEVTFATSLGVDYYILVHGYGAFSFGDYTLEITCEAPCSPLTTNDDCADAVGVTVQPSSGGTYTSANDECAFPSLMGNNDCGGSFSTLYDIFYTFNSGSNSGLYFESSVDGVSSPVASGDYYIALYEGTDCDAVYYGCAGFTMGEEVYIDGLDEDTDYLVRIYTSSLDDASSGNFNLMVKQITPPANDECGDATALTVSVAVDATTIGASESLPAGSCGGNADDDVWFSFVAPAFNVDILVDVDDFVLDPVIEVRSGACDGTEVACSDDFGPFGGGEELIDLALTEGQTYYVRVYGADEGFAGDFSIRYQPAFIPPPANDNPALNTPVMNSVNYVYPNCMQIQGTTVGATFDGVFGFLPDVWYQFNAISNGVSVRVNAAFDSQVTLWEFDGVSTLTEVATADDIFFAGGTEIMNFGGLTENTTYYIQVIDWDGNGDPFSICVQKLRKPNCATVAPYSLCTLFKSSVTGAQTTTFAFTDEDDNTTSITNSGPISLGNQALGLLYDASYDVTMTANYALVNGVGGAEPISVSNAACSITTVAHPQLSVKVNQRCANGAVLYRNSYLQATTNALMCGATGYRVEFTPVDDCAGTNPNGLETFEKTITSASPSISLSYAFNQIPLAGNSGIGDWSVRWAPRFGSIYGDYGPAHVISVNGTAPAGMLQESAEIMNGLESTGNAIAANLYPNPNNGDMVNLNMTGITTPDVFVRIMDGMGRVVYTNRYTVDGSLNTIVTFSKPLAAGLYMVEFTAGTDVITERMMVTK